MNNNVKILTIVFLNILLNVTGIFAAHNTIYQAHNFNAKSGNIGIEYDKALDGNSIGGNNPGDWVKYDNIVFNDKFDTFMVTAATTSSGNKIDILLDSPTGTRIGTITVTPSGAWDLFIEQYASISSTSGTHDVYLVFLNGRINVNWFVFAEDTVTNETAEANAQRMAWFNDARFGMFIHWGAYSYLEGVWNGENVHAEWIMNLADISKTDYENEAAKKFNPTKFNAAQWVEVCKQAEQKYMVITAKHHEGFCMFDTQITNYDIMDFGSYSGEDPFAALKRECDANGIKFCAYYSQADWHHPLQSDWGYACSDVPKYAEYVKEHMRELIEKYDIALAWFDPAYAKPIHGNWWTSSVGSPIYKYLRILKPDIIVNDRIVGTNDFKVYERKIPDPPPSGYWETCKTLNERWGYAVYDTQYKPLDELLNTLDEIIDKGGNFLLNTGPTGEGLIIQPDIDRLRQMGEYIRSNGNPQNDAIVSLYKDTSYSGWQVNLGVGNFTAADIIAAGGSDNDVSSIKVSRGYMATMYDGNNFTGNSLVRTVNDGDLRNDSFNDILSSIRVEALVLPTPTPEPPTPTASQPVCGDVNADNAVDIIDALLVAQYYVGLAPTGFSSTKADVNRDGGIDIIDALIIAQYYVGLTGTLNC